MTDEGAPARRPPRRILGGARTRILATIIALLAFSTTLSFVALRQILIARVDTRVDGELSREVGSLSKIAASPDQKKLLDVNDLFTAYLTNNVPSQGELVLTYPFGGKAQANGGASTAEIRQLSPVMFDDVPGSLRLSVTTTPRGGTAQTPIGAVRYQAVPVKISGVQRGVFIVVGTLARERREVDAAIRVAGGVSVAVLLIGSLIAFLTVGKVLAPLRELRGAARSITETDLSRRIQVEGRDEIAELGHTFNDMLDRLESAFAGQKAFVSDAGHELRTPITIIRGHLELLGDDPEERRETIEIVTDELDRMSRFVDDLLLLAKAEHGDFLHYADVDLDVLTEELMAKAVALADRDWRLEAIGAGRLTADRQRLTQAVMQLAVNASQHTSPGDRIGIGTALSNGHARLWVSDTGPGVPKGEEERIFERFARAGNGRRRSEGAGLGLSIVRAIAEGHGGRVELSGPGKGSETGATFTVIVPTTPPEEVEVA